MCVLEIRRLRRTDAATFRRLRLSGLRLTPEAFGATWHEEVDWSVERHAGALETGFVLGCERDGVLIGVVGLRNATPETMKRCTVVWGMYVEPDARRLGVGALLLAALVEHARNQEENLTLTVDADNLKAIALYHRFGFVDYKPDPQKDKVAKTSREVIIMHLALAPVGRSEAIVQVSDSDHKDIL